MEKDTLILIIKRSDLRAALMDALCGAARLTPYEAAEVDHVLRVIEDLAVPPVQYELPLKPGGV